MQRRMPPTDSNKRLFSRIKTSRASGLSEGKKRLICGMHEPECFPIGWVDALVVEETLGVVDCSLGSEDPYTVADENSLLSP